MTNIKNRQNQTEDGGNDQGQTEPQISLSTQGDAIIAAGYTRLAGFSKPQKPDMMAWSMDLNGIQKWIKRYEVPGSQSATDITQINNNRYLLSGGKWFFEIDSDGKLIKSH